LRVDKVCPTASFPCPAASCPECYPRCFQPSTAMNRDLTNLDSTFPELPRRAPVWMHSVRRQFLAAVRKVHRSESCPVHSAYWDLRLKVVCCCQGLAGSVNSIPERFPAGLYSETFPVADSVVSPCPEECLPGALRYEAVVLPFPVAVSPNAVQNFVPQKARSRPPERSALRPRPHIKELLAAMLFFLSTYQDLQQSADEFSSV
jgi:hypothetical protein